MGCTVTALLDGETSDLFAAAYAEGKPRHELVAVDCEMCITEAGQELTRVSLVGREGQVGRDAGATVVGDVLCSKHHLIQK